MRFVETYKFEIKKIQKPFHVIEDTIQDKKKNNNKAYEQNKLVKT